jgi:hypothetical protein
VQRAMAAASADTPLPVLLDAVLASARKDCGALLQLPQQVRLTLTPQPQ